MTAAYGHARRCIFEEGDRSKESGGGSCGTGVERRLTREMAIQPSSLCRPGFESFFDMWSRISGPSKAIVEAIGVSGAQEQAISTHADIPHGVRGCFRVTVVQLIVLGAEESVRESRGFGAEAGVVGYNDVESPPGRKLRIFGLIDCRVIRRMIVLITFLKCQHGLMMVIACGHVGNGDAYIRITAITVRWYGHSMR